MALTYSCRQPVEAWMQKNPLNITAKHHQSVDSLKCCDVYFNEEPDVMHTTHYPLYALTIKSHASTWLSRQHKALCLTAHWLSFSATVRVLQTKGMQGEPGLWPWLHTFSLQHASIRTFVAKVGGEQAVFCSNPQLAQHRRPRSMCKTKTCLPLLILSR